MKSEKGYSVPIFRFPHPSTGERLREVSIHCALWLFCKKKGQVQGLSKFVVCMAIHDKPVSLSLVSEIGRMELMSFMPFVGKIVHSQVLPAVFQISYDWFCKTHLNSPVVAPLCERPGIFRKRYVKPEPLLRFLCQGPGSRSVGWWWCWVMPAPDRC